MRAGTAPLERSGSGRSTGSSVLQIVSVTRKTRKDGDWTVQTQDKDLGSVQRQRWTTCHHSLPSGTQVLPSFGTNQEQDPAVTQASWPHPKQNQQKPRSCPQWFWCRIRTKRVASARVDRCVSPVMVAWTPETCSWTPSSTVINMNYCSVCFHGLLPSNR